MKNKPRVFLIGNPGKPSVAQALDQVEEIVSRYAQVVGKLLSHPTADLNEAQPELVVVLGGDGMILGVARALGRRQVPLMGVNLGKLGYLAEFSLKDLEDHFEQIVADPSPLSEGMMLDTTVCHQSRRVFHSLAMNDCVVQAGPPYRMIELAVMTDGQPLSSVLGDGLIVSTPIGSTAHNMSAGGPIVENGVNALVITPICPHSLAHRPLVLRADQAIDVIATRVNEGTTVAIDGQFSVPLHVGDHLSVRTSEHRFKLVRHPGQTRWHTLLAKLKWGVRPDSSS
jgi:NAD+ kinase